MVAPPVAAGECTVDAARAAAALTAAASALEAEFATANDPWQTSPFRWVKTLPAPSRGKVGVALAELLLRGAGFAVAARSSAGHDRVVESVPVQVRFSTLWSAGWYTFQKVRPVGDYEVLILLGLSPTAGHAWVVDRAAALDLAGATSEAGWLTVDPTSPPSALTACGGALDSFFAAAAHRFGPPSAAPHGPARIVSDSDSDSDSGSV
jgi:hypothetical protein